MKHTWTIIAEVSLVLFLLVSTVQAVGHEVASADVNLGTPSSCEPLTYVNSDADAYKAMLSLSSDEPIHMLNMIRYKERAEYDEASGFADKGWSGEQAYAEYGRYATPIATRVGGRVLYSGAPQLTMIGAEHEQWDAVFIMVYPNLESFLALVGDPEYQKHAFHRSAALEDSRLIRMQPSLLDN